MTLEELKIRQLSNQYLLEPGDKQTVIRDLCGIQAQFMTNAMHSLKIRCQDYQEACFGQGLVKNWTIRGTVHVFAEEDIPLFIHCNNGANYKRNKWTDPSFWNQRDCWSLSPQRQTFLSEVILQSLETGSRTRDELKEICREHGMTAAEEGSMFDQWGGGIRELCERGFMNYVVQEKKAFCLSPDFKPIPEEQAKLEMARRFFTNLGPATVHDAMYFFHATSPEVKKWLVQLPVISCECQGKTYYYIENGRTYGSNIPDCLFLAGFDQLMLGYEKKENLFLPQEHLRRVFNLAGIVMPPVMLRGKIVGKWKKTNRRLTVELFESVSESDKLIIRNKADSLWQNLSSLEMNG